jgi:hypothetical protein
MSGHPVDVVDTLYAASLYAEIRQDREDLREAHDAVVELIAAVESERVIWANEGNRPGWIGRVESATARTTAALARCKGGAE